MYNRYTAATIISIVLLKIFPTFLPFKFRKGGDSVVTAETEGIADRYIDHAFLRLAKCKVQVIRNTFS